MNSQTLWFAEKEQCCGERDGEGTTFHLHVRRQVYKQSNFQSNRGVGSSLFTHSFEIERTENYFHSS